MARKEPETEADGEESAIGPLQILDGLSEVTLDVSV